MKKLLSLPPNLVDTFHALTGYDRNEWFCTHDPVGAKLGSGGGTAWAIAAAEAEGFLTEGERVILLHAGGQSRRLPAYAPSGKVLTPVPVFRWQRGQRVGQTLLDIELPLYEEIMAKAPQSLTTMIVSGDVYIRRGAPLQDIPEADVVCYGLWVDLPLAAQHGVFVSDRHTPDRLAYMLQKPSVATLGQLMQEHFFLMDIGIWLLSERALALLRERSMAHTPQHSKAAPVASDYRFYDLYSDFGLALGDTPQAVDNDLANLTVAILPLPRGEFYHYGTSPELLSSTLTLQNLVTNQQEIPMRGVKPHPSIFLQNTRCELTLTDAHAYTWLENAVIGSGWTLGGKNILTGIPDNDWTIDIPHGVCLDIVPLKRGGWAVRPYGYDDPHPAWLLTRLGYAHIQNPQTEAALYPVVTDVATMGRVATWMIHGEGDAALYGQLPHLTAEQLATEADLVRLFKQRDERQRECLPELAAHYERSIFYQLDLADVAREYRRLGLPLPAPLPDTASRMMRISDAMFRARLLDAPEVAERSAESIRQERRAFSLMQEGILQTLTPVSLPHLNVYPDQIVWGRSPVRLDLAGGWSDTPPFSLVAGGNVVNIAVELGGQPPLQVFIKPAAAPAITLRSIDLGATEVVETYEQLSEYNHLSTPFSIPKAALSLAGFLPAFSTERFATLREQLEAFGGGIEMTTLSAVPAGSGLGTSSILSATVLGALSDFCGLGWDRQEICHRTFALEQLLTSGGGWQDQWGGVLPGVKLLQTSSGWLQHPLVRHLPDTLWTDPAYTPLHLLYYTGITRVAKHILGDIVRNMFLCEKACMAEVDVIKQNALDFHEAVQRGDFTRMGGLLRQTWQQNQRLDAGTNPPAIAALCDQIDDLCLGYRLPGAGGGGFLYMIAKDEEAAALIRRRLTTAPPNNKARFVSMSMSKKGFEVSRS